MDIEKLIERLNQYSQFLIAYKLGADFADACIETATALSTLQTENEKLREKLEQVKKERDEAVERLREWEKFETYLLVHNFLPPEKWRGIKEN